MKAIGIRLIALLRWLEPVRKIQVLISGQQCEDLPNSPRSDRERLIRNRFPKFSVRDTANSVQRLVKEEFGINNLVTTIGASVGAMQVLHLDRDRPPNAPPEKACAHGAYSARSWARLNR